jgi:sarcosine oxidase subunit alpha
MTQSLRLASGGAIDRAKPLWFFFDGRALTGYEGDTLASALLANDERLIARSFKYHRPRGLLTAGPEEPNALVTLGHREDADPNVRATNVALTEGLVARSQNAWPWLGFDLLALNSALSPFLVAGFYYKTFKWPSAFWEKLYEPLIRRAAGLGELSRAPDPTKYDRNHAFCDVLIIGGGAAGLATALTAGRAGARIILADEDYTLGGRLQSDHNHIDDAPASLWLDGALEELNALPNVRLLTGTSIFGLYDGGVFGALETPREGLQTYWKICAKRSVLAAGALERPLVFSGNDTPGVMLASAASTYAQRYAVAPGLRTAIFTTSDSGHQTAAQLVRLGVHVECVIDPRDEAPVSPAYQTFAQSAVIEARGGARLNSIVVRNANGATQKISVDCLLMSGGWTPSIGLASHLGQRPAWSDAEQNFVMENPPAHMRVIGAAAAHWTLSQCLADGFATGAQVAADLGYAPRPAAVPTTSAESARFTSYARPPEGKRKAFIDFQNDVTTKDVDLAVQEGYRSVEHLKRYTTLGMATDQGKTSNLNGYLYLGKALSRPSSEVGTIIARPPHTPVPIGAFAGMHQGEHFRPTRLTPSHDWAKARGAPFVDVGQWKRAQYFPLPGETDWLQSVTREVKSVRTHVGICDVSTLGKIEVQGADAAEFLDRIYANRIATLKPGRARYGLMLREDGLVLDDGTIARFAEDRFFITTTTASAARVMQHIEYGRQILWPDLDVQLSSSTEHWAQFAVAGPNARALLQRILPEIDLSAEAFPFMAACESEWCGVPIRLFRISFSGELAYEIAVPVPYGDALARALMAAGAEFGVTPYGTEALGVMRIEKGHPAGGELNGQVTAGDLGLGKMLSMKKYYIGRALSQRPALMDPDRPTLMGFKPVDKTHRVRAGAHLLSLDAPKTAAHDQGWLSSAAFSPMLGSWIALGLIRGGAKRQGEKLLAYDPVRHFECAVEVCAPVFFDPEGARLHG